jgi:hypothetical protein
LSLFIFVYATSYFSSAQVAGVRFFAGFLMAVVLVIVQGLTNPIWNTAWCNGYGCQISRSAIFGMVAAGCFFVSGLSFLFMSDYPCVKYLAEIQENERSWQQAMMKKHL